MACRMKMLRARWMIPIRMDIDDVEARDLLSRALVNCTTPRLTNCVLPSI